MESYESMMDNQLPASGQTAMAGYQTPVSFPQFPDNDTLNNAYGNLPGMAGSYPSTPTTPGSSMNMGGYNTPSSQQSGYGNLSSSSTSSFSMPYDPPSMPGAPSLPMPTPPQPQSNKPIYSCTYCGLVLSSNNALIEHKRIHTGERPFACHICDKRFTQKAHLNIHKRIHTGEKPYPCHICHKRFAQSSHLSSHKRIHTGEKPFVCGICHIGFTQKQRLDAHLKKHMERPGQDIGPTQNRHSHMMPQPARMDTFPQSTMRDDSHNFMHMVGQGMPYIKQETGVSDIHSNNALRPNLDLSGPNDKEKLMGRHGINQDLGKMSGGNEMEERESNRIQTREDVDGGEENRSETDKSPKIATPSFSSEGMFLHPSGYVAYGGIEDSEESPDNSPQEAGSDMIEQPHQHQGNNMSGGGHRRKPSVVRKRYSESPGKETDNTETVKSQTDEPGDAVNGIHKFHALNQNIDQNSAMKEGNITVDDQEAEDFQDTGEVLDDKNDPPYHGSVHVKNGSHNTNLRKSSPQDGHATIETRSHSRRTDPNHTDSTNSDRMNPTGMGGATLSYTGSGNSHASSGLVKINNRISLVNFTADELIAHLMKRDDIHRCQFCCLIFQDAAMYHIHRNMHDKQDIRRCNMCGKLLLDKYDFTAHFLSMHQS